MENGETVEMAAAREVFEETGVRVSIDALYSVFAIQDINQVYIVYRGTVACDQVLPGPECQNAAFVEPDKIPWDNIFYPAITDILKRYVREMERNTYGIYTGSHEAGKLALIENEKSSPSEI
ncbi:MAG: NUDIX domain-containing protein [Cellvibrionaceae bacterium]|nr:NUDIX domain-containing protein [Cellvibrionaceae bacterium]